jgi:drug/metabolite transporter (DMT)-like permease
VKQTGKIFALLAALLFGASAPVCKLLLGGQSPQMLAGLLYLGAGAGLAAWMLLRRFSDGAGAEQFPPRKAWGWLAGAVVFGGIVGPVLLMNGLKLADGAAASLLLNLESPFTALIAWTLFREAFKGKVALGIAVTLAGGVVISWTGSPLLADWLGPLLVAAACLSWGFDNNCTRRIAHHDPVPIVVIKGLIAAGVNIALARAAGDGWPSMASLAGALLVGLFGYGVSIVLFIHALRRIGAARSGAFFATAPFFGALLALALGVGEPTWRLAGAGILMALGILCL